MESFIHADIFFLVTTIAVVVVIVFFTIAIVYSVRIFKKTETFVDEVKKEGERIIGDIGGLRQTLREEGGKIKVMTDVLTSFMARRNKTKTRKKTRSNSNQDEVTS